MKNLLLTLIILVSGVSVSYAQNVAIPDPIFKAALLADTAINKNGNNEIEVTEALAAHTVNVGGKFAITDMTGISYFQNLEELYCNHNKITNLDLSSNRQLKRLYCQVNELTQINLSQCTNLTDLSISSNKLTRLNLNKLIQLYSMDCRFNGMTELILDSLQNLSFLNVSNNELKSLKVTSQKLTSIFCSFNKLEELIFPKEILTLRRIDCNDNLLTSLLLNQSKLAMLKCGNNKLKVLSLSNCSSLKTVDCKNNQLKELNLYWCTPLETLDCSQNPDLNTLCLYYTPNIVSLIKDPKTVVIKNCGKLFTNVEIPDRFFKSQLLFDYTINFDRDTNITFEEAQLATRILLKDVDVGDNYGVRDLKGLAEFVNIEKIGFYNNKFLKTIDLSSNIKLKSVEILNSPVAEIDLSLNSLLDSVKISGTELKTLNLHDLSDIDFVNVTGNTSLVTVCIPASESINNVTGQWKKDAVTSWVNECGVVSGIGKENNNVNNLIVFPNPARDKVYVDSNAQETKVYNVMGDLVLLTTENEFSVGKFGTGVYLVMIKDNQGNINTARLIKE